LKITNQSISPRAKKLHTVAKELLPAVKYIVQIMLLAEYV